MLPLAAAAAAADAPAVDAAPPPYPFAMCSNGNMLSNPEYPVKMLDAGARMCRVDVTFNTVRPQPGDDPDTWNWNTMEKIRGLRKQHPDLQFLVLLGYGPAWAEDPKFKPEKPYTGPPPYNCPQAGVNVMPPEDPKNLYGHYVYETVRRYKDVTKHWESWNEPDLPGAHYFKGNGKDFFAYQKACYLAAKKADPECNVVFAGLCYATFEGYLYVHKLKPPTPYPPKTCFFEEYLREGVQDPDAKRNNYYFDIMNQHSYSRASDLYDYAAVDAKLMQDYLGEVKPIWVTEMGMTDNGPNAFGGTPADYAEYQLQAFAWGKLAGVERFFHFQLDNSNQHGLYKGMLGEPKPALTTYRDVLVKEFAQAKFVKQLHGSTGVDFLAGNSPFDPKWKAGYNAFEFRSHDGRRRLLIAFADTADAVAVKLPATQAKATLITSDNQRREIAAKDGSYEIALTGAVNFGGWPVFKDNKDAVAMGQPEFLVGGATVVIVEE
ncbi:MAG: hypothetical protein BWZ02_00659 [Lentisphaerae bacterium ADurb.BinA184]|nr:MAG: hypothetical protein BWZ02_00659 [Lentisphaerae bacterium ADurb.BinA184]